MSFERLRYDPCAATARLRQSAGPGQYRTTEPLAGGDGGVITPDDRLRAQGFTRAGCPQGAGVDVESGLRWLGAPLSECPGAVPRGGEGGGGGGCLVPDARHAPDARGGAYTPIEDTRLSNPPSTLRATGWNRFHPTCFDPQDIGRLEHGAALAVGVSSRTLHKDNHVACVEAAPETEQRWGPRRARAGGLDAGTPGVGPGAPHPDEFARSSGENNPWDFAPKSGVPGGWYQDFVRGRALAAPGVADSDRVFAIPARPADDWSSRVIAGVGSGA